jgi:hypothetical protein
MPERRDPSPFDAAIGRCDPERHLFRLAFAAGRIRALAETELRLLELAVDAPDDETARCFELYADTVWRDARAVCSEHDPDQEFLMWEGI